MDEPPQHPSERPRPLEGLRVLDLSRVLAGPLATPWLADVDAVGVPAGPINSLDDLDADPWSVERGHHVELPHPTIGTHDGTGFPVRASATPAWPSSPPPTRGQHTDEVLTELGYTADEVARITGEREDA